MTIRVLYCPGLGPIFAQGGGNEELHWKETFVFETAEMLIALPFAIALISSNIRANDKQIATISDFIFVGGEK